MFTNQDYNFSRVVSRYSYIFQGATFVKSPSGAFIETYRYQTPGHGNVEMTYTHDGSWVVKVAFRIDYVEAKSVARFILTGKHAEIPEIEEYESCGWRNARMIVPEKELPNILHRYVDEVMA